MSDILYFEDGVKNAADIENSIADSIAEEVKNIENTEGSEPEAEKNAVSPEEETAAAAKEPVLDEEASEEPAADAPAESSDDTSEAEEKTAAEEETSAEEAPEEDSEDSGETAEDAAEEKKSFLGQISAYGEKIREGAVKAGNAVKEQTVKAGEQIKDAGKKVAQKNAEPEEEVIPQEKQEEENIGTVRIADDVVAMIAMYAAQEVEGVAGMAESNTREWLGKVGIKDPMKGVRVEVNEKNVRADLQIIMGYGYNIPATSSKVQARVKQAIENMTGLTVTDVNVRIAGITVSNENSEN